MTAADPRHRTVLDYMPVVVALAGRLARPDVDPDDLAQEGSLALVAAVDSFDPASGRSLHNHVVLRVGAAMLDLIRRAAAAPATLGDAAFDVADRRGPAVPREDR